MAKRDGGGWIKERTRADGSTSFQARWTDDAAGSVIERARTFASRDEAEDFLREQLRAKRDGRYAPPSTITVRRLIEGWLERGATRLKPSSVYAYRERAINYIYPSLSDALVASLTTPKLQHWVDSLSRAGLAPATVHAAVIVLQSALREGTAIGLVERNPALGLRRPTVRRGERPTWTDEEIGRVLAAVRDEPMWSALYRVALSTGMRPGELRALQWADVRPDELLVRVRRTISRDAAGHDVIGTSTKTGRERTNALPASAMAALLAWRAEQRRRRIARANVWHDLDLIFERGDGRVLPKTAWNEQHDAIIAAAGVRPITLHALRHSAATRLLERNIHPKVVADILGHVSVTTTLDVYSHSSAAMHRSAVELLDRALDEPPADNETSSRATTSR